MKTTLLTVILTMALAVSAQSIDTTTVQPSSEYFDFDKVKLDIVLQQYDSILHADIKEHPYGIVFQGGKGAVYNFQNLQLLTEIKYDHLHYAGRSVDEDSVFHLFTWEDDDLVGKILISESSGTYLEFSYKK